VTPGQGSAPFSCLLLGAWIPVSSVNSADPKTSYGLVYLNKKKKKNKQKIPNRKRSLYFFVLVKHAHFFLFFFFFLFWSKLKKIGFVFLKKTKREVW